MGHATRLDKSQAHQRWSIVCITDVDIL